MPEEKNEAAADELDENAELLPNREVMSMIAPPVASPEEPPSAG